MIDYWSDSTHRTWGQHYATDGRSNFLIFSRAWGKSLPQDGLQCKLLDTETGTIYQTPIYAAYEIGEETGILQPYFYQHHHCPCHRYQDARSAGLGGPHGYECEGNRFQIQSITALTTGPILYSETLGCDSMEEVLVRQKLLALLADAKERAVCSAGRGLTTRLEEDCFDKTAWLVLLDLLDEKGVADDRDFINRLKKTP